MGIDDDRRATGIDQFGDGDFQKCFARDRKKRFGCMIGVGAQSRSQARSQDQCFHVSRGHAELFPDWLRTD